MWLLLGAKKFVKQSDVFNRTIIPYRKEQPRKLMYIKEILHYDEESREADVFISDGQFELLCYVHPYIPDGFDKLKSPLSAYMTENVMRALENAYKTEKLQSGYYSYRLHGKIIDLQKRLVAVGHIIIELENVIPKDIGEGEFIEFTVMRIHL